MRSVKVVFPLSMCAEIPMFRAKARSSAAADAWAEALKGAAR
tara:strand:+ start:700 stop:825 length:126 start_codon:yes stop_codon:yes gene_type:complete